MPDPVPFGLLIHTPALRHLWTGTDPPKFPTVETGRWPSRPHETPGVLLFTCDAPGLADARPWAHGDEWAVWRSGDRVWRHPPPGLSSDLAAARALGDPAVAGVRMSWAWENGYVVFLSQPLAAPRLPPVLKVSAGFALTLSLTGRSPPTLTLRRPASTKRPVRTGVDP